MELTEDGLLISNCSNGRLQNLIQTAQLILTFYRMIINYFMVHKIINPHQLCKQRPNTRFQRLKIPNFKVSMITYVYHCSVVRGTIFTTISLQINVCHFQYRLQKYYESHFTYPLLILLMSCPPYFVLNKNELHNTNSVNSRN
jgi:hypothetical protein